MSIFNLTWRHILFAIFSLFFVYLKVVFETSKIMEKYIFLSKEQRMITF